jgi:CRP-like cAMP-binding protein
VVPFDDTMFLKQNVDVLAFFTDDQLRRVTAVIDRKTFKAGQTVIFQGEVSNNFFVIKRGRVQVAARSGKEKMALAELKAGDFFGEISLLESTTATATIKALEDNTEILTISHDVFQTLLKQNPYLEARLRERIEARKKQKLDIMAKKDDSPKEGEGPAKAPES